MYLMNTGPSRLSIAAVLAAPLVYALFLAANALITIEDVTLVETENRILETITPSDPPSMEATERPKPKWLEATTPPAAERQAPPLVPTQGFGGVWTGEVPAEAGPVRIKFDVGAISTGPLDGRILTPVRPPAPSMPSGAVTRGISGECDVYFDVDIAGRPQNVVAKCTDNVFRSEAERAVRQAEFLPAIRNGRPVEQKNAVYPIVFNVN